MYTCPIQLNDVRYNAATQCFEASVTVHDNTIQRKYACAISAPITMTFEQASQGLAKQAVRRHVSRGGLYSETGGANGRYRAGREGFDPVRWLKNIVHRPLQTAA